MTYPRPYLLVLTALLAATTIAACGGSERDPKQFPISRDELVGQGAPSASDDPAALTYRRYCVGCHGNDGVGNGGMGANLAAADSPLRTRSEEELFEAVKNGKVGKVGSMPAHKPVLSDAQIHAVIAYARATFAAAPAP